MPQSDFLRAVERSGGLLQKAQNELEQTKRLAGAGDMAGAYESAFAFAARAEQLTLLARALPAYTGHPKAAERTEELLEEVVPVELGFTRQGWFCLRIPALLPRKERGSPSYLRDFLYPAMRRFFAGKLPCTYPDSVLIFRHIYVADVVALYLLPDDTPRRCAHYYCSASGDRDRTEVYVVPCDALTAWLHAAKSGGLEGVELLENLP